MADERTLIVGLGNPVGEYGGTRHNLGADAVRLLADDVGLRFRRHRAGGAAADGRLGPGGPAVTLFVPSGYMNTSGGPVQRALRFYRLALDDLVVVYDDIDLPAWVVRLKRGGGPGGHNGVRDIINRCGGRDFLRVRIGVGRPPGRQDPASYVLARIPAALRDDALSTVRRAVDATRDLVTEGLEAAQNIHHAPA
ncbi:MAG: aminoacyl-tRNA hydrolase [Actinobacteria bacterium]|nr:aminoacyl-tRNA hydrolase [Actinomycetota bacterium]